MSSKKFIYNLKNKAAANVRILMPAALLLAVAITVGISYTARQHHKQKALDPVTSETNATIIEEVALEENAYTEVNDLFTSYYTAMADGDTSAIESVSSLLSDEEKIRIQVISQYIDHYTDINVYTKPGPSEDSWIAFVYSKMVFVDHDWEVPGMQAMYVCTRDDGSLYINTDEEYDAADTDYIQAVAVQDDVVDLNNKVAAEYNQLLADNSDLSTYLDDLSSNIDVEVGTLLAQLENNNASGSTNTYLRANDEVNVRSGPSQDSEVKGQTVIGTTYEYVTDAGNGWSKIIYQGAEAYVKTEYFDQVDLSGETVDEADTEDSADTEDTANDAEASAD